MFIPDVVSEFKFKLNDVLRCALCNWFVIEGEDALFSGLRKVIPIISIYFILLTRSRNLSSSM
jgi:hypothetical protein